MFFTPPEFKARLVHQGQVQTREMWGSVQVRRYGFWGDVCLDDYTDKEAAVACRTMGFKGGRAYGGYDNKVRFSGIWGSVSVSAQRPVWISHVVCNGTERSLEECQIKHWGVPISVCDTGSAVICYNIGRSPGVFRQAAELTAAASSNTATISTSTAIKKKKKNPKRAT